MKPAAVPEKRYSPEKDPFGGGDKYDNSNSYSQEKSSYGRSNPFSRDSRDRGGGSGGGGGAGGSGNAGAFNRDKPFGGHDKQPFSRPPQRQQQAVQDDDEENWDDDDDANYGKVPSPQNSPQTNTSPHSMMMGDATPLYDEN